VHFRGYFFRVFAAFFAERERDAAERFFAALRAWLDNASFEAALRPSFLSAFRDARERLVEVFFPLFPFRRSRRACSFVSSEEPSHGGNSTPARRAFASPIAIACFVERAPCLPSRICSISSFTNSPAWVLGALPSRLSFRALSSVSFSGITTS